MSKDCLFCRIVAGEIPAKVVDESPGCLAFRDVNPEAPVHILVVPKKHVRSLAESDDPALLGEMLDLVRRLAVKEGVSDSGYRTVLNTNRDGGQSVDHIHAHLLGGRKMAWPPG
jgi:histidine triad (HIT) family protein